MGFNQTRYTVVVGGTDISSAIAPILLDLSVSLQSGSSSDTATIKIDDTGGMVRLPSDGALALIKVDGTEIFRGKVNDIKSDGDRGSGRTLTISCSGVDMKGKAKEPRYKHHDDKKVEDILKDAGKYAGIPDVKVDPAIGSKTLKYFQQANESFMHLGHRLGILFGGTFKIMGDRAVMVERNAGKSASGRPLTPIAATYGQNLISWSVEPVIGRPRLKRSQTRWYDQAKAKWVVEKEDSQDSEAPACATMRFQATGETEAKSRSKAASAEADREKGSGTLTIDGNAAAVPEAPCTVSGARAGVDGSYIIDAVTHNLDRGGGFATTLTIKRPGGGAGEDSR